MGATFSMQNTHDWIHLQYSIGELYMFMKPISIKRAMDEEYHIKYKYIFDYCKNIHNDLYSKMIADYQQSKINPTNYINHIDICIKYEKELCRFVHNPHLPYEVRLLLEMYIAIVCYMCINREPLTFLFGTYFSQIHLLNEYAVLYLMCNSFANMIAQPFIKSYYNANEVQKKELEEELNKKSLNFNIDIMSDNPFEFDQHDYFNELQQYKLK